MRWKFGFELNVKTNTPLHFEIYGVALKIFDLYFFGDNSGMLQLETHHGVETEWVRFFLDQTPGSYCDRLFPPRWVLQMSIEFWTAFTFLLWRVSFLFVLCDWARPKITLTEPPFPVRSNGTFAKNNIWTRYYFRSTLSLARFPNRENRARPEFRNRTFHVDGTIDELDGKFSRRILLTAKSEKRGVTGIRTWRNACSRCDLDLQAEIHISRRHSRSLLNEGKQKFGPIMCSLYMLALAWLGRTCTFTFCGFEMTPKQPECCYYFRPPVVILRLYSYFTCLLGKWERKAWNKHQDRCSALKSFLSVSFEYFLPLFSLKTTTQRLVCPLKHWK